MANAKVTITMDSDNHQMLKALLQFHAGIITREEFSTLCISAGCKTMFTTSAAFPVELAKNLLNAIR